MSSIKNTQIDGDVSVGRNVSIGGNTTIQGYTIASLVLTTYGNADQSKALSELTKSTLI